MSLFLSVIKDIRCNNTALTRPERNFCFTCDKSNEFYKTFVNTYIEKEKKRQNCPLFTNPYLFKVIIISWPKTIILFLSFPSLLFSPLYHHSLTFFFFRQRLCMFFVSWVSTLERITSSCAGTTAQTCPTKQRTHVVFWSFTSLLLSSPQRRN